MGRFGSAISILSALNINCNTNNCNLIDYLSINEIEQLKQFIDNDFVGTIGPKGNRGKKGDQGIPGLKGNKGIPGLKGDLGIPGCKGDQGEQGIPGLKGNPGEKGLSGIYEEPRDVIIDKLNIKSDVIINNNRKISPYLLNLELIESTNCDNITIDNDSNLIFNNNGVYNIDISVPFKYRNEHQRYYVYIGLSKYNEEKTKYKILKNTLQKILIFYHTNVKRNATMDDTLRLVLNRKFESSNKYKVCIFIDSYKYKINEEEQNDNIDLYLYKKNINIEIVTITNNFTIGQKGEKGEKGLDGEYKEPRYFSITNLNICEDITLDYNSYCNIEDYYVLNLEIVENNVNLLNIENNRNIIINEKALYYFEVSINIEYKNIYQTFNVYLLLFQYDEDCMYYKPLIDTLSKHTIITKTEKDFLNNTRIDTLHLKTQRILEANSKYHIGIYIEYLQYNLPDYKSINYPSIKLIKNQSKINLSIITSNFQIVECINNQNNNCGLKGDKGDCSTNSFKNLKLISKINKNITNKYENSILWNEIKNCDCPFIEIDKTYNVILDNKTNTIIDTDILLKKWCKIEEAKYIANNLQNCIGFDYKSLDDVFSNNIYYLCIFKAYSNIVKLIFDENFSCYYKNNINNSYKLKILEDGIYNINYFIQLNSINQFNLFVNFYKYDNITNEFINIQNLNKSQEYSSNSISQKIFTNNINTCELNKNDIIYFELMIMFYDTINLKNIYINNIEFDFIKISLINKDTIVYDNILNNHEVLSYINKDIEDIDNYYIKLYNYNDWIFADNIYYLYFIIHPKPIKYIYIKSSTQLQIKIVTTKKNIQDYLSTNTLIEVDLNNNNICTLNNRIYIQIGNGNLTTHRFMEVFVFYEII